MSNVNNIIGNIENINTAGIIESIITTGNITTISATAQIVSNNIIGRLGFAQVGNSSKVKDVLVNGKSVVNENGNANIEIPDISEFIKNTVDNLVNYYLKSETYSKEEIDKLAKSIEEAGYATEEWVKDQNYMPISDFQQIMDFFYYNKTEIDEKLNNLPEPTIPLEFNIDFNLMKKGNEVIGYTNTGYIVDDNYIRLQPLADIGTTGINKIVYTDKEIIFMYDGSNKIRRFKNGIDFDVIELPVNCISLIYHTFSKRLIGTDGKGYFIYSDDDGDTWNTKQSSLVNGNIYLFQHITFVGSFLIINITTKKIITVNENFAQNTTITSTIVPTFISLLNKNQYIWCNNAGTFKYGAGSQEGNFASISGVTVNMLKTVNEKPIIGLKNSNKLYIIKATNMITGNEWISYTLPDTCTVNDIIFNSYDQTYYIFTDINTYYKTKDFIKFDSVDKNGLRGLQGAFTLMGIQTTTENHNALLLAPTTEKIESILQMLKRATDKDKWLGPGLEKKGSEQIGVKTGETIAIYNDGVSVKSGSLDYLHLTEEFAKKIRIATADTQPVNPFDIDNWFWSNWDGSPDWCCNAIFTEAGTFYNPLTYAEEYTVEKAELGYFMVDEWSVDAPYTKRTSLGILLE